MRKIAFFIALPGVLFFGLPTTATTADFACGSGTEDDPYLVETAEHLDNVRNHLAAHFKQIADIDLSDYAEDKGWDPIGCYDDWEDPDPFSGTYDGNNHKVANLVIERPDTNGIALFALLENGKAGNIVLEEIEVSGNRYVGGLAGRNEDSTITDTHVRGNVSGNWQFIGGISGRSSGTITNSSFSGEVSEGESVGGLTGYNSGEIINCHARGSVTGEGWDIGGLAGNNRRGSIANSYAETTVSGEENRVGGLVGRNYVGGDITDCYATGDVSGEEYVGGLVGSSESAVDTSYATGTVSGKESVGGLAGSNDGPIRNCYARGKTTGEENIGGLVGFNEGKIEKGYATGIVSGSTQTGGLAGKDENGEIESSFYDQETTSQDDTGKGIPKTTEEMMQQGTFEGWDFEETYGIVEEKTYPYLQWVMTDEEYETKVAFYDFPALYKNKEALLSLTFRNTGTKSWEEGSKIYLGAVGNEDDLTSPENYRIELDHRVEPAQTHTFTIPVYPEEKGTFTTEWRMLKEGEFWFGEKFNKEVVVTTYTDVEGTIWQRYK